MVTQGKFKPPSERDPRLDPGIDPIVMKALASNKDERYQTAEEFRDAHPGQAVADEPDHQRRRARALHARPVPRRDHRGARARRQHEGGRRGAVPGRARSGDAPAHGHLRARRRGSAASSRARRSRRATIRVPTAEQLLAHPQRRGLFIAGTLAALVAGGAVALLAGAPEPRAGADAGAADTPSPPPQPTPVVTPLETPPPTAAVHADADARRAAGATRRAPARQGEQGGGGAEHGGRRRTRCARTRPIRCRRSSAPSRASTPRSSRSTAPVLEDKWNAIASEITFGKADKFDKVDAMLDALRHEMAKVKAGGCAREKKGRHARAAGPFVSVRSKLTRPSTSAGRSADRRLLGRAADEAADHAAEERP